jgi:predicted dehydrogenase
VGVIGAGPFAECCHVPGLHSHPDAEVAVFCGPDWERTIAVVKRVGVPDVSIDYEGRLRQALP